MPPQDCRHTSLSAAFDFALEGLQGADGDIAISRRDCLSAFLRHAATAVVSRTMYQYLIFLIAVYEYLFIYAENYGTHCASISRARTKYREYE